MDFEINFMDTKIAMCQQFFQVMISYYLELFQQINDTDSSTQEIIFQIWASKSHKM